VLCAILFIPSCSVGSSEAGRLAESILEAARQLKSSADNDATVEYEFPEPNVSYSIEIHPCMDAGRLNELNNDICGPLMVRAKGGASTSTRHLKEVVVPARLERFKPTGGPSRILLRRKGEQVSLIGLS